jgi:hypothetical protein
MALDKELIEREASRIKTSVKAMGANPDRAKEAIIQATKGIVHLDLPNGQESLARRLMARLIAFRLARLDGNERLANRHDKQFDILREKLIRKGVPEDELRNVTIDVTKQIVGQ